MTFSVIVGPYEDRFSAAIVGEPEVRAVGGTPEAAIAALKAEVVQRIQRGELITLDIEPLGITGLAGKYRDDPTLRDICAEAYRERDADRATIVFDTDVLTDILDGVSSVVQRAMLIPPQEQAIPIVAAEEILRGRLNAIRQAESGKLRISVARAYELMRVSLADLRNLTILPYSDQADLLFQQWRARKIRVSTHDLRIAAVCVSENAKLVSRNRRDYDRCQV